LDARLGQVRKRNPASPPNPERSAGPEVESANQLQADWREYQQFLMRGKETVYFRMAVKLCLGDWRAAAEQGEPKAQCLLGQCIEKGIGVARDDGEAVRWYRRAAEQGDSDGQVKLGAMYLNGRGVGQDDAEAVRWFRKAAEQGDSFGQCYLGYMYQGGRGVGQDHAEAVRSYRKAAEQGHAHGQVKLGKMYLSGRGVGQNDAEAVRWFRKAAEQGDPLGQCYLGTMYQNGFGRHIRPSGAFGDVLDRDEQQRCALRSPRHARASRSAQRAEDRHTACVSSGHRALDLAWRGNETSARSQKTTNEGLLAE
jgi:TPR repeat protein